MKVIASYFSKRYRSWNRRFTLSKRQQFILITIVLTIGLLLTQLVPLEFRYSMVLAISVATFFLCAFGLRDDLKGAEWLTLLTLPTLFTAGVSLFYFLLPVRWLTRLPVVVLYAVGMYALLLTENIFSVAKIRTIALLRAAHSVGFLLTLLSYFLIVQTILVYRFEVYIEGLTIAALTYILLLQSLASIELETKVSRRVRTITFGLTLVLVQIAWVFYFWPVNRTLVALLLTTCFYTVAGMGQQYLVEKLYKRTVTEFAIVAVLVFFLVILASRWRGAM